MNAIKELLLRIRSTYDKTGTDAAAKAVGNDLAVANDKASAAARKTGKDVSDAAKRGADGLNVMSVATAAMQGNFNAAAAAAVPLLEKSKSLNMSMTQLSLGGAALTAVVTGLKAISEYAAAAAQRVANIQMDNFTNKVRESAEAYDKLVESMRNVTALKDAALAFNNSMVDSYTRQALAINNLNKQRELASTSDETKRKEIEAKYADQAASITGMSVAQKEAQDRARSLEREQEIEKEIKVSRDRQDQLIKEASEGLLKGQNASATVRNNLGLFGSLFGSNRAIAESYSGVSKEYGKLTGEKLQEANDQERRREQLENERREILRIREKAAVDSRSGMIERTADDVASNSAASDRKRVNQEALYQAWDKMGPLYEQLHPTDQKNMAEDLRKAFETNSLTADLVNKMYDDVMRKIKIIDDKLNQDRNR